MDPERLAGITVRMQAFVDEGEIAGAVLLLVKREGTVLHEAVGFRDLQAREPMRTDAIFRMASVAKPVTALGIMMLQEEGRLLVDDAVERYLPAFQGTGVEAPEARTGPIRLRHLLTHTSGLAAESVLLEPHRWPGSNTRTLPHARVGTRSVLFGLAIRAAPSGPPVGTSRRERTTA